jgi:hypothetical protein
MKVKELIEHLSNLEQDAEICGCNFNDQEPEYFDIEIVREFKNVDYFKDSEKKRGDIVALY